MYIETNKSLYWDTSAGLNAINPRTATAINNPHMMIIDIESNLWTVLALDDLGCFHTMKKAM